MSVWPLLDERDAKPPGQPSLIIVTLTLVGLGALLYLVGGVPQLPSHWPDGAELRSIVQGSAVPIAAVQPLLVGIAWLFWLWAVWSLVVEVLLCVFEALSHGAAWVRRLRALADRATLPIARRAAEGAIVAAVVANVVGRSPDVAAAAPLAVPSIHRVIPSTSADSAPARPVNHPSGTTTYTVRPGDNLWEISAHFYGTGHEYQRIVNANAGKRMADGEVFSRHAVIQPGWALTIPLPGRSASVHDGQTWYTVQPGDTLRGIAARFLGDEARWPEIFQANQGKATLPDGRTLTDPDLIWPGLRLVIPSSASSAAPALTPASTPPASHHPSSTTEPVQMPAPPKTTPNPDVLPVATPAVQLTPTPVRPVVEVRHHAHIPTTLASPVATASWVWPTIYGGIGIGAAATAAVVLARRRSVRQRPAPVRETLPPRGFVESDVARQFAHQLASGEPEPVLRLASQVLRLLDELGIHDRTLLAATANRHRLTILLEAGLAARDQLLDNATDVGRHLGGTCIAALTQDQDVLLEIADLSPLSTLATAAEAPEDAVSLVPIGALGTSGELETVYLNWRAVSNLLIVGAHADATQVILTSVLGALVCQLAPDALRLWTVARPGTPLAQQPLLPHHEASVIDPRDRQALLAVLEGFRAELDRRRQKPAAEDGSSTARGPDWVLVLGDLMDLPPADEQELWASLDLLSRQGPACGLQLIGVSARPLAIDRLLLEQFQTRLVLWLAHDEESALALGDTNAPDLGPSELFARVEGRRGVRLRGFKISEENRARLAKLMQRAHGPSQADTVAAAITDTPMAEISAEGERAAPSGDPGMANADNPALCPHGSDTDRSLTTDPVSDSPARLEPSIANARQKDAVSGGPNVGQSDRRANDTGSESVERTEAPVTADQPPSGMGGLMENREPAGGGEPLFRIRCFRSFEVMSGARILEPVTEKGPKYQAWELLALLASQPTGRISREGIFGALWSDGDEQQLAHRLRGALYYLREILSWQVPGCPSEVVSHDRGGTWKLDPTLVWTDVREFWKLIRSDARCSVDEARGRYERARALYRGSLLSDAPYRWLDERSEQGTSLREDYHAAYSRITRKLAELYEKAQQPDQAVPLYVELIAADPTEEKLVRRLYRCYRRLGDRSALIRAHRHWKEALAKAFCDPDNPEDDSAPVYEPAPETTALYEQIIAELRRDDHVPEARREVASR